MIEFDIPKAVFAIGALGRMRVYYDGAASLWRAMATDNRTLLVYEWSGLDIGKNLVFTLTASRSGRLLSRCNGDLPRAYHTATLEAGAHLGGSVVGWVVFEDFKTPLRDQPADPDGWLAAIPEHAPDALSRPFNIDMSLVNDVAQCIRQGGFHGGIRWQGAGPHAAIRIDTIDRDICGGRIYGALMPTVLQECA